MSQKYLNILMKGLIIFFHKKILSSKLIKRTRYGENPHQKAAIYSESNHQDIIQLSGKELSYNNYNDLYSALMSQNYYQTIRE